MPSTAATTSTRTKPNARDTAVTAPIRVAAPVHDCPGAPLRRFTLTNAPSRVRLRRGQARRRAVAVAVVPDGARAQILEREHRGNPALHQLEVVDRRHDRRKAVHRAHLRHRVAALRCVAAVLLDVDLARRPSARSRSPAPARSSTVRSVPAKSLWVPVISSARAGVGGNVVMSALPGSIEMKPASESRCKRSGPGGSLRVPARPAVEVSRNASASSGALAHGVRTAQEVGGVAQRLDVAVVLELPLALEPHDRGCDGARRRGPA